MATGQIIAFRTIVWAMIGLGLMLTRDVVSYYPGGCLMPCIYCYWAMTSLM